MASLELSTATMRTMKMKMRRKATKTMRTTTIVANCAGAGDSPDLFPGVFDGPGGASSSSSSSSSSSPASVALWVACKNEELTVLRFATVALAAAKRLHEEQQQKQAMQAMRAMRATQAAQAAPQTPANIHQQQLLPPWLEHMSAGAVLVSVVSDGIGALEKVRRHDVASEHLAC